MELQTFADGMYDGTESRPWIEPEIYHAIDRLSRSRLVHMLKSAASFRYWETHPTTATNAMIRGDAIHAGIMEPRRFHRDYALEPDFGNCSRKGPRDERNRWRLEHEGQIQVPKAEVVGVYEAIAAVTGNPELRPIFDSASSRIESSMLWTEFAENGEQVAMRARTDVRQEEAEDGGGPVILDLKSVEDASPRAFWNVVRRDHLELQAATYLRGATVTTGIDHRRFGWVAVEKNAPYEVGLYWCDEPTLEVGQQEYADLVDKVAACRQTGVYPGLSAAPPQVGGLSKSAIEWYWKSRTH